MPAASRTRPPALAVLAALVLACALLAGVPAAAEAADGEFATDRLEGDDRVGTAIAVSEDVYTSAETVFLARADHYADALAAGPAAASLGAPVLLTPPDALPAAVAGEIGRLGATAVRIVGGEAAVSGEVQQALVDLGLEVARYAGGDRFETAALIARDVDGDDQASVETVFVVQGAAEEPHRGWPDAVAVSAYAGFLGVPIVPVLTDVVPPASGAALQAINPRAIIVVGGHTAVSEQVAQSLADDDTAVRRIAGADRYETSAEVYDEAVSVGMDPSARWLATGAAFADALTAGPAAAQGGHPLLLIDGSTAPVSPVTFTRLSAALDVLDRLVLVGGAAAIGETAETSLVTQLTPAASTADYCLTVLHNNDGESQLLSAPGLDAFGGIARFASLVEQQRQAFSDLTRAGCEEAQVLTVTSGDNFLAGPEFSASLDKGVPFYDSTAIDLIGYDALALGNHDFDFGPEVTADFVEGVDSDAVFLSANLDFSAEPDLQALVDAGRIAGSTTIELGSRVVGVIGATTPELRSISSPRGVVVEPDVAAAIAAEVEAVTEAGADIVVLISHLQGLAEDMALIPELSGVDIVVAGGGDEVLGSPGNLYVPGDEDLIFGDYPLRAETADGATVPVVTTAGDYKYLGRLVTRFDAGNELQGADALYSRMLRVADASLPGGVPVAPAVLERVVEPVVAYVADLAETVIGVTQVPLDGSRPAIRQQETNLGDLLADAEIAAVQQRAAEFGLPASEPVVAIVNGGGIRNNSVIPAGELTELTTFDIAPFANFVAAVPGVEAAELKELLEHGYAAVEEADGRFAQIGGMAVEVDLSGTAQEVTDGAVTTPGSRVVSVTLADGTPLVVDGEVVAGAPAVTIATVDFTARGGDAYPFDDPAAGFTTVGISYQQALLDYIRDDLGGTVTAERYPVGGTGRITFVE